MKYVSLARLTDQHAYQMLFDQARKALENAQPIKSNFKVGAAAIVTGNGSRGKIINGWNTEFRNSDSVHAEESITNRLEPGERILRLLLLGEKLNLLTPCGNCREVIETYNYKKDDKPDGRVILPEDTPDQPWSQINALLPGEDYPTRSWNTADQVAITLFGRAVSRIKRTSINPYTPFFESAAVYFTDQARVGIGMQSAAWHNLHAIEILCGYLELLSKNFNQIVVVNSLDTARFPCGRCRQLLFELSQYFGEEISVLAADHAQLKHANISQLLPKAFGPKDLGVDLQTYRETRGIV